MHAKTSVLDAAERLASHSKTLYSCRHCQ